MLLSSTLCLGIDLAAARDRRDGQSMAQSRVLAQPPQADRHRRDGMTQTQLRELDQYEKIVRLRDLIVSGAHPSIKVPEELLPGMKLARDPAIAGIPPSHPVQGTGGFASGHPSEGTQSSRFDPTFLERSDELVRAEIQLERQRIERALKDEVESRRVRKITKAELCSELDLSAVLSTAMTLVEAGSAPLKTDTVIAANNEDASDSFDDNTFYSSQHDTPPFESSPKQAMRPQQDKVPGTTSIQGHGMPSGRPSPVHVQAETRPSSRGSLYGDSISTINAGISINNHAAVPGLNNYPARAEPSAWARTAQPGVQTTTNTYGTAAPQPLTSFHVQPTKKPAREEPEAYVEANPPSPFIRTHDLQPIAPQPAQPVHSGALPIITDQASGLPPVTEPPAQVIALRQEAVTSGTSTESSPRGNKGSDKKKGKKKKRKNRDAQDIDAVVIKPEPRSPSPVAAPAYIRPNKRQRHANGHSNEARITYDDPSMVGRNGRLPPAVPSQPELPQLFHTEAGRFLPRAASAAIQGDSHYARMAAEAYPVSETTLHIPREGFNYPPNTVAPPRDEAYQYHSGPVSYSSNSVSRVRYEDPRMSVRPDNYSFALAQRPEPTRIYVDAYGREFLEPPRPTIRQSVAPSSRYAEPEPLYERPPVRAASRFAEPPRFAEGAPVYMRPASTHPGGRRVATQPEYLSQVYGDSRYSEYPQRQVPPSQRRVIDLGGHDESLRAASNRPQQSSTGDYSAIENLGYTPSIHQEPASREYAQEPPLQQPNAQPYVWEYEARPTEQPLPRRNPHAYPQQHYYQAAPGAAEDVTFVEQHHVGRQETVYAENPRDELYH